MTIKVLATGYTAQHIGSQRLLVKYGAVTDMFVDIMRRGGCEVDHRRVRPDEDISGYDLLFCGQIALGALGASYCYGALDAIARAKSSGVGLMFFLDDWQVNNIVTSIKTLNRDKTRVTRESLKTARMDHDWAMQNLDRIFPVVEAMLHRPWPITLVPKFSWGDGTRVVRGLSSREWVWTDVSAFAPDYNTPLASDNERIAQWVCGTLSDQRSWIAKTGVKWHVEYLGSKKSKADNVLSEVELCELYGRSWGVMAPKYPHAGSGWWRNRFIHSVRARSIMLADPSEVRDIGESFLIKPYQIESMNIAQLREVADAQRADFYAKETPAEQVIDTVMGAVHRAIAEVQ